jgi:hypothetical protein
MTAKEKIDGLLKYIKLMAILGKAPNEDGTLEESEVLYKVAVLGVAMGKILLAHVQANHSDDEQDAVTE